MLSDDGLATSFEFEREVAFSRESNQPKQYVQNLLTRDAAKIYDHWIRYEKYKYPNPETTLLKLYFYTIYVL